MRRYLLDTNALGDAINRRRGVHERVARARAAGHVIGTSVIAVGELLAGIEGSETRDANLKVADRALVKIKKWPFAAETAPFFGRLQAFLRRIGRPMQPQDVLIAATALELGRCTVVTTDSDFLAIPGLTVENWAA